MVISNEKEHRMSDFCTPTKLAERSKEICDVFNASYASTHHVVLLTTRLIMQIMY